MRGSGWMMAASAVLLGFAVSGAQSGRAVAAMPDAPAPEIIAGRQAAFRMSAVVLNSMKAAVERGDPVKSLGFPARSLTSWAKALPGMFPAGSGTGAPTEALPTIWSDRAGFEARAADYANAAAKLGDLAASGDNAGFAAQLAVVGKACGDCHQSYRKPSERRPG